jgi:hypothetical protein
LAALCASSPSLPVPPAAAAAAPASIEWRAADDKSLRGRPCNSCCSLAETLPGLYMSPLLLLLLPSAAAAAAVPEPLLWWPRSRPPLPLLTSWLQRDNRNNRRL